MHAYETLTEVTPPVTSVSTMADDRITRLTRRGPDAMCFAVSQSSQARDEDRAAHAYLYAQPLCQSHPGSIDRGDLMGRTLLWERHPRSSASRSLVPENMHNVPLLSRFRL